MTLRFMDSFDDRSSVNFIYKWGSGLGTAYPAISTTYGRHDQGMFISNDGNIRPSIALDTTQDTWIIGFAFKVPNASISDHVFLLFWDMSIPQFQIYLTLKATGVMEVRRGDGTLLLSTSASFTANAWQYFELKYKVSNTVGTIEIMRNGVSVGTYSGDTQNTAQAYCTNVEFRGGGFGMYIDDLYLCDGAGSDTFRGDCTVECLAPTGAGATTQWTPSTGSNYQNVDDPNSAAPAPDGDSTYNSSTTPGNIDLFTYGNLATVGKTVLGVQIGLNVRKTNAGTRHVQSVFRQGGSNYLGSELAVSDNYYTYVQLYITNPHTGVAWTTTDINTNAEFGYGDES